jgi:hypothetical protein
LKEATPLSPRTLEVFKIVPQLLETYFDVLIAHSDLNNFMDPENEFFWQELLPLMFQRLDQLFPHPEYQQQVRKIIEQKTIALFYKFPSFIITFKVREVCFIFPSDLL